MEVKYIGLCGVKGSGKSTLAKIISEQYNEDGYKVFTVPFADGIKNTLSFFVSDSLGIDYQTAMEYFIDPNKKEIIIPDIGASPRTLMCSFGTDFIRNIDSDFWITYTKNKIQQKISDYSSQKKLLFIFDDIRFENELEYVMQLGEVYFISRTELYESSFFSGLKKILCGEKKHRSEKGLYHLGTPEMTIINNGDFKDLKEKYVRLQPPTQRDFENE